MDSFGFISFLCVLLAVLLFCMATLEMETDVVDTDVPDHAFPSKTLVYNRNISCGDIIPGLRYPSQTWTCSDAKVDGKRLAYGLYPDLGVDNKCTETEGLDELGELCIAMMKAMDVSRPLWSAFVTNATCGHHDGSRSYLNKTINGYSWVDMPPGFGWIHTFKCMADFEVT